MSGMVRPVIPMCLMFGVSCVMVSVPPARGAVDVVYEYDANGNMTKDADKYYEYNDANQLVRVRQGSPTGTVLAEYTYDHTGQRVKKVEGGTTTYYVNRICKLTIDGSDIRNTSYYFIDGERVAQKTNINTYQFNIIDHLGSIDIVTEAGGESVSKNIYLPFGEQFGDGVGGFQYNGKELDERTGKYYYETRYYSSRNMRFISPDTIKPDHFKPQELNRYAYVYNNPLRYVDPSGKWGKDVHYGSSFWDSIKEGESYGTLTWAKSAGFNKEDARTIAKWNQYVDEDPLLDPLSGGNPRHLNNQNQVMLELNVPPGYSGGSTILAWAEYELHQAIYYKQQGDLKEALKHLGMGLHSYQDYLSHANDITRQSILRLAEHLQRGDSRTDRYRGSSSDRKLRLRDATLYYLHLYTNAGNYEQ